MHHVRGKSCPHNRSNHAFIIIMPFSHRGRLRDILILIAWDGIPIHTGNMSGFMSPIGTIRKPLNGI